MTWNAFLTAVEQVSTAADLPGAVIVAATILATGMVASVALVCGTFLLWRMFARGPDRRRVPEPVPLKPIEIDWTPLAEALGKIRLRRPISHLPILGRSSHAPALSPIGNPRGKPADEKADQTAA